VHVVVQNAELDEVREGVGQRPALESLQRPLANGVNVAPGGVDIRER